MKKALALSLVLLLAGCGAQGFFERYFRRPGPSVPTYLVGEPYAINGVWQYPREDFQFNETGLAKLAGGHADRTASGEAFDQTAFAAAHRTLPLPSIIRVTNLENGRQMLLRLNDRGPEAIGRMLELTAAAGRALGVTNPDATRVRVEVLEPESKAAIAEVQGNPAAPLAAAAPAAPQVTAAPKGGVQAESLAPPSGAASTAGRSAAPARAVLSASQPGVALEKVDGSVRLVSPHNASLSVECGSFGNAEYGNILRARLAQFGARLETDYNAPRDRAYFVRVGHFTTAADADAMLDRLLRAGIAGAHVVVE